MAASLSLYKPAHEWWGHRGWSELVFQGLWALLLAVIIVIFMIGVAVVVIWYERKIAGDIQSRIGPARVGGRFGVLQTLADGLKLFFKEDIIPNACERWLFVIAPFFIFVPAVMAWVAIPFSPSWIAYDLDIGVFYIVAISSLPQLGLIMAGWSSNNKYALLGGMRAVAQLISYEIPLVLAVLVVAMYANSLSMVTIVEKQASGWFILHPTLFIAFIIFFICALAETNKVPFDLPEAESELVSGYHVEYSGMRFAFFFLSEYASLFFLCAMATTLFLGGWRGPLLPPVVWFLGKTGVLVTLVIWIRWTVPRLRIDQITRFGWKFLLPLALLDLIVAAFLAVGMS